MGAALALLAAIGCTGGGDDTAPAPTIEGVAVYDDLGKEHVDGDRSYDPVPPVGGDHAPRWLKCDVYDRPVPDENAVHSLEHGAVWITHDPALTPDELTRLRRLHGLKPEYVVISPFEGLPSLVVASAWGLQLRVDGVDDPRLAEFVKQYAGGDQGGEGGADCVRQGITPPR